MQHKPMPPKRLENNAKVWASWVRHKLNRRNCHSSITGIRPSTMSQEQRSKCHKLRLNLTPDKMHHEHIWKKFQNTIRDAFETWRYSAQSVLSDGRVGLQAIQLSQHDRRRGVWWTLQARQKWIYRSCLRSQNTNVEPSKMGLKW